MHADQQNQISLGEWTLPPKADPPDFTAVCNQALQGLNLPADFAIWQQNKTGSILKFGSTPVIGMSKTKSGLKIQIRSGRLLAEQSGLPLDPDRQTLRPELMGNAKLREALQIFFDSVIDQLSGDRFACCSLYRQCSANRRCVQPDRRLAIDCAYRRNLKAGQIYLI